MSEDQLRAELECAKQEVAELRAKLAAAEAERDIAMEKAAEAYRELDAHQQAGQLMASQCELVNAEREAAEARAEKAEAERSRLAAFAREIISFECWGYQQIDGGDIQEIAENMGLIEASIATEADAATMNDVCAGDRIYRFAPWLRKMMDGCVTLTQEQDNG